MFGMSVVQNETGFRKFVLQNNYGICSFCKNRADACPLGIWHEHTAEINNIFGLLNYFLSKYFLYRFHKIGLFLKSIV